MRTRHLLLCLALALLFCAVPGARAQEQFTAVRCQVPIFDKNGQPWSDLDYVLRVRLHPENTKDLPNAATEIYAVKPDGTQTQPFTSGSWRNFKIAKDAKTNRTVAGVELIVFQDAAAQPVVYQIDLHNPKTRESASALQAGGTTLQVRNDNKCPQSFKTREPNSVGSILKRNWPIIAGVLVLGILMTYFLIFRWMFAGLLRRQWGVGAAQNLTWAMSLLVILMFVAGLAAFLLGLRIETYILLGLAGASFLLVLLVGLISGSKTTA